ncbi:hypothetical protein [Methyloraptor flagellatus]|jgi:hypothetical protein|uniref:Uncharacterized protein n=1 Tax=Methyloraptor flagellatus TaxID=3162530 RepID=A0AAU7XBW8_9HYPH
MSLQLLALSRRPGVDARRIDPASSDTIKPQTERKSDSDGSPESARWRTGHGDVRVVHNS